MDADVYEVMGQVEERHWWFRGRRAVIAALLERLASPPTGPILDAGCGTGRNLALYAPLGPVEGVDPSPLAVEHCHRIGHTGVRSGDAMDLPFEAGRFALIAATDVLEHVPDEAVALSEMRRVARPGAPLLLTVPAYGWLWSAEDERLGHYRRYTLSRLCAACHAAGWEPEFGTYFNTFLLPAIALVRRLPPRSARPELERTPGWLAGPLSLPMRLEARLIKRGFRFPAGVSAGLVCRRA